MLLHKEILLVVTQELAISQKKKVLLDKEILKVVTQEATTKGSCHLDIFKKKEGSITQFRKFNARLHEDMQHLQLGGMLGRQSTIFLPTSHFTSTSLLTIFHFHIPLH